MTDETSGPGQRPTADHGRVPPRDRFAGDEHLFDLASAAEELSREPGAARNGHRQIALFRHDTTTIVLFAFEAGGQLLDHAADGCVMVQVLGGELRVTTPDGEQAMHEGSLLVLMPGVHHDVRAVTASRMLLTVSLAVRS